MVELMDSLPLINAIRDYGCGYDHSKDKDDMMLQQQQRITTAALIPVGFDVG